MINHIRTTKMFERHLKQLRRKHYDTSKLEAAIRVIATEDHDTLVRQYRWHILKGNKAGINEIHLEADWLLLYEITRNNEMTLLLLDTGSHAIL
ncbi:type II toxin-antitoxin system YafQ family toxin [Lactiplantibacillus daowaiensis]|uniref:Type II toxin-antitoxin system YafQ family toxin n=1 Tax=Lactiplantibacillus daowaiensis TaxID=2559918 RepID=A0ABW1S2L7_9LACO|nr:type II toxin-antitoxin system YafQ family toxin [Lactiplantibacillus daowaiensis]